MANISLIEFYKRFSKDEKCYGYLEKIRWPDGICCPWCGGIKFYKVQPRGRMIIPSYRCAFAPCDLPFTVRTGTLFDGSRIKIHIWFYLIYGSVSSKKNMSSVQLGKNMGVSQKSLWGMMHKIRGVFEESGITKLSGIIEIDEVFVSKGDKWTRWGGISTRKAPILGLIERGGKLVIKTIEDRSRETLESIIRHHVVKGSTIYTDGWNGYCRLIDDYVHESVCHSTQEYVRGKVHTNNIENVWSRLKRSIKNAHHSVSSKHIQRYCDEVVFRHNYRHFTSMERFNEVLRRALSRKKWN